MRAEGRPVDEQDRLLGEAAAEAEGGPVDRRTLFRKAGVVAAASLVGIGVETKAADASGPFNLSFAAAGVRASQRPGRMPRAGATPLPTIVNVPSADVIGWWIIGGKNPPTEESLPIPYSSNYDYLVFNLAAGASVVGNDDAPPHEPDTYSKGSDTLTDQIWLVVIVMHGTVPCT